MKHRPCEDCRGLGFLLMQNDSHGLRIERCDACQKYRSDDLAVTAAYRAGVRSQVEPADSHATGYSVGQALDLARTLKHGPLPKKDDPPPTPDEALEIIQRARRTCGFNWITGEVALAVIQANLAGRSARRQRNPYPDWSDEHRAWKEAGAVGRTGRKR